MKMIMIKKSNWVFDPYQCVGFQKRTVRAHQNQGQWTCYTEHYEIKIPARYGLVNITNLLKETLQNSQLKDGLCFVSAMHITAGIYVNDAEEGLLQDLASWLEKLAPFQSQYLHHRTGEDNGDAHLKSFLTNHSTVLPVTEGVFDFGPWQQVFYAEFDGMRKKRILVKCTGIQKNHSLP